MRLEESFRDAPLRRKLMLIGLVTSGLALFYISLIMTVVDWVSVRSRMISDLTTYANVIGTNAAAAILFDDRKAAAETLAALAAKPEIVHATIHDANGELFATYLLLGHPEDAMLHPKPGQYLLAVDRLTVAQPVTLKGDQLGVVYLEADMHGLYAIILRDIGLIFAAALTAFLMTMLLFSKLQKAIVNPIRNLANAIQTITTQQNYAIRVAVNGKDEIGMLSRAFNSMLDHLQARDDELVQHREHLETEVTQRTRDLKEANRKLEEELVERKRAETELRIFRTLLDNSSDAVEVVDLHTQRFLDVNEKQCTDLGYSRQELLAMVVSDIDPNFGPTAKLEIEGQLRSTGAARFEAIHRRRDGSTFPVEISSRLVELDRTYILNIVRDITDRKQAEAEAKVYLEELSRNNRALTELNSKLEQAQNQLLQSEKMASIGLLASGVAHEINNPIGYIHSNLGTLGTYVKNFIEVLGAYEKVELSMPDRNVLFAEVEELKKGVDMAYLKQDVTELLTESHEGVDRVRKIVQDLKDFSRIEAEEKWAAEDIHHGLDSTLNVIWNELKYKCEVKKEYGVLPPVECLLSQLNQVFMNLLVNAAQAIETKGTITIRTGTRDDLVWIEIADTGVGVAPEHLSRLYDPFFTTKPVGKGTGLGLSVSFSIVQKHHGKMEVESTVGQGTLFRVLLPVRQPVSENKESAS